MSQSYLHSLNSGMKNWQSQHRHIATSSCCCHTVGNTVHSRKSFASNISFQNINHKLRTYVQGLASSNSKWHKWAGLRVLCFILFILWGTFDTQGFIWRRNGNRGVYLQGKQWDFDVHEHVGQSLQRYSGYNSCFSYSVSVKRQVISHLPDKCYVPCPS
jgi:hypothetical protein